MPSSAEAKRSEDSASKTDSLAPAPGTALKPAPTAAQISPQETAKAMASSAGAKRSAEIPWETPDRKRPAKEMRTEMHSPLSATLRNLHPRKSKQVVEARRGKCVMPWGKGKSIPNARSVDRNVDKLEPVLAAMANCDTDMASAVLFKVLKRSGLEQMRKQFLSDMWKETDNEQSSKLVDNIRAFVRHHPTKGSRPQEVQDAVDAILVAATFGPEKKVSLFQIADSFGVSRQIVDKCNVRVAAMRATGAAFKPAERQQRSDCIRAAAKMAVHEFCHSEEGSNVDTESYRIMKLLNVNTNKVDGHPLRVWHEMTNESRFNAFEDSNVYKEFRETHEKAEICIEVFRLTVCPCVRNPGPQSCVDLLQSGLKHYMTAIDNALKHNNVI